MSSSSNVCSIVLGVCVIVSSRVVRWPCAFAGLPVEGYLLSNIAAVLLSLTHWTCVQNYKNTCRYTQKNYTYSTSMYTYIRIYKHMRLHSVHKHKSIHKHTHIHTHCLHTATRSLPAPVHSDEGWRPSRSAQPSEISYIYKSCDTHVHTHRHTYTHTPHSPCFSFSLLHKYSEPPPLFTLCFFFPPSLLSQPHCCIKTFTLMLCWTDGCLVALCVWLWLFTCVFLPFYQPPVLPVTPYFNINKTKIP